MTEPLAYPELSPAVETALECGKPVIALESTVITHGLPYPQNFETLKRLEAVAAEEDALAATIIVKEGKAHIGLSTTLEDWLEHGLRDGRKFKKLGLRDLPLAFAQGLSGGTTVSATMKLAHLSGIKVFATGGIGGVHRGWQETPDVSSDLTALATIPVTVVSAGCKAILDIHATLELLEAYAIPVLGWRSSSFPCFYTRDSEYPIDRLDGVEEFVRFHRLHSLISSTGILIANPIPVEYSIGADVVEPVIAEAIAAASAKGVKGKALTPFLLDFLARRTKGGSVKANLALLEHNVRLAAKLARALCAKG